MKHFVTTIAVDLDARRTLLIYLRNTNPYFFKRLYARLQDKLAFTDFDKALLETLAEDDIVIVSDNLTLYVQHKVGNLSMLEKHDDYESALQFAIALLRIK